MTADVVVRQLGVDDVPLIMPLMTTAFDADYSEAWTAEQVVGALSFPKGRLLGCTLDGRMVGFALLRNLLDESELLLVALAQDVRRQGIGRILMREVIEHARACGASRLFLEVRANNPAIKFYQDQKFQTIGTRPNYYRKKSGELMNAQTMVIDI